MPDLSVDLGLDGAWRPESVECGAQDRLDVSGVALDRRDRVDHLEDLLEREVLADFARALGGGKEGLAGSQDSAAALAEQRVAGLTLVQMATAFATSHPAVTSTIIGPRTMEHLDGYLAADGIELSTEVLDHIDQIVPPGVTINVADNMWHFGTPALGAEYRRR